MEALRAAITPTSIYLAGHLLAAVFTDLTRGRIPNRLVLSLAAGGVADMLWKSGRAICAGSPHLSLATLGRGLAALANGLAGAMVALGVMLGLSLVFGGAIGGGDIKLMAAAGLYLGPLAALEALVWTFVAGGVLSLLMLIFRLTRLRETIPYAPAIAIGVLLSAVAGA